MQLPILNCSWKKISLEFWNLALHPQASILVSIALFLEWAKQQEVYPIAVYTRKEKSDTANLFGTESASRMHSRLGRLNMSWMTSNCYDLLYTHEVSTESRWVNNVHPTSVSSFAALLALLLRTLVSPCCHLYWSSCVVKLFWRCCQWWESCVPS